MRTVAWLVASAVVIGGCGATPVDLSSLATPIAPSPQAAPPTAPPNTRAEIAIRSIEPGSGAALQVFDCSTSAFVELCSRPWLLRVDVVLPGDIANAVVAASFFKGSEFCAYGVSRPAPYSAGTTASFEISDLWVSGDTSAPLCPLPVETTRMVVGVRSVTSTASFPVFTQQVSHSYTFYDK
jgi:hypothetical protein